MSGETHSMDKPHVADQLSATDDRAREQDDDEHSVAVHILSCKPCRQRKVRCDRNDPCTQCTQKQIPCFFPAGFKQRPKRQKALVSDRYEEKLDDISRKIDRIYLAVDNINASASPSSQPTFTTPQATPYTPASTANTTQYAAETAGSELEGELSLDAHAAYATDYVQQAIGGSTHLSDGMMSSLQTLRQAIAGGSKGASPKTNPPVAEPATAVTPGNAGISLPPMPFAMAYLQRLRESERLWYFWSWEVESVGDFVEYLLPVYSGQPSTAEIIIVSDGLSRLFSECRKDEKSPDACRELQVWSETCRKNVDIAMGRLPFLIPSSFDYVYALFLSAMYLLQQCRPLPAWRYVSEAAQLCCTLGYNRETAFTAESASQKRRRSRVFWLLLMIDKVLSLTLGRSSTLRDIDITLQRPSSDACDDEPRFMWAMNKWIDYSLLYGKVYDDVFSPWALRQSDTFRLERTRELAKELQAIFESISPAEIRHLEAREKFLGPEVHELLERAEKVSHLSTLTLVYRGIPAAPHSGSAFSEECVAAAHEALVEHQRCLNLLRKVDRGTVEMYLEWTMLSAPFIPYIVLFCRIVQTCDSMHLDKLASVVETLQMTPTDRLPEAFGKQLRIFRLMYDVAHRYVEAKKSEPGQTLRDSVSGAAYNLDSFMLGAASMPSSSQQRPPTGAPEFVQDSGLGHVDFGAYGGEMLGIEQVLPQMGSPGVDLGSWFDQSSQIIRMMGDGQ